MDGTMKRDWGMVAAGVGMILIGFAFLLVPGITLIALAVIAGAALIASGVVDVIAYARYRKDLGLSGWMLAAAILDIVLGAAFVIHPLVSAVVLPWLAAIAFAIYGVLEIVAAWRIAADGRKASEARTRAAMGGMASEYTAQVRETQAGGWGWSLFGGLVALACAAAFFFAPESFALFLAFFVMIRGIVMIGHGVSLGAVGGVRHQGA